MKYVSQLFTALAYAATALLLPMTTVLSSHHDAELTVVGLGDVR